MLKFLLVLVVGAFFPRLSEAKPKIAVLLPLSGEYADYGELQRKGYQLAQREFTVWSQQVDIRYFDVGEPPLGRSRVIERMKTRFGPDLVIGPYSSENALDLKGSIGDLVWLLPSAVVDVLSQQASSNRFRIAPPASFYAQALDDLFKERRLSQKVHVIAEDTTFPLAIIEKLKYPNIQWHELDPSRDDTLLPEVEEHELVVGLTRSLDWSKKILDQYASKHQVIGVSAAFSSADFLAYQKYSGKSLIVLTPWMAQASDQKSMDFQQAFLATYKSALSSGVASYHSAQAYSALKIALESITQKKKTLHQYLRSSTFQTPLGDITFDSGFGFFQQSMKPPKILNLAGTNNYSIHSGKGSFFDIIRSLFANQLVSLFSILLIGLALGRVSIFGISFGSAAILFVALVFGHFNLSIPAGVGSLGLVLFIYCVGLAAGSSFFSVLASQGVRLVKLSVITLTVAMLVTYLIVEIFNIRVDLALGMFAGALTSTPALASALDLLKESGSLVTIGYGLAYPFGVIGVVIFVQLVPKILGIDFQKEAEVSRCEDVAEDIVRLVVTLENPRLVGEYIVTHKGFEEISAQISRKIVEDKFQPIDQKDVFELGMKLMVVTIRKHIPLIEHLIGEAWELKEDFNPGSQMATLMVNDKAYVGKSLAFIYEDKKNHVVVSRIKRGQVSFVPTGLTKLARHDLLTVVGEPIDIEAFAQKIAHRPAQLNTTDIGRLSVGMLLGVLLGLIPIHLPGGSVFSLGLAGGPLMVALVLSHFGKAGFVPEASRVLLSEFGLMLFLAHAGIRAGQGFVATLMENGLILLLLASMITIIPLFIGFLYAKFKKIHFLDSMGAICGAMTSTPALGAIQSKTDSKVPVMSYSTAYPVALILVTLFVQLLYLLIV